MKDRYMMRRAMTVGVRGMARLGLIVALLIAGLLVAAPAAQALVFDLNGDHCTGGCGTSPFGTVTLTQNGTTVDVTVHLNSPNYFVKTGSVDLQAFKFNGTGVALADISVDPHIPGLVAATGAFNGDGTGQFAFGINCPTCGSGASNKFNNDIMFQVANAQIADLTAANAFGAVFVADIIGSTGRTGPVYATEPGVNPPPPPPVPEPGTILLLGSGLSGLAAWRRRRSRA